MGLQVVHWPLFLPWDIFTSYNCNYAQHCCLLRDWIMCLLEHKCCCKAIYVAPCLWQMHQRKGSALISGKEIKSRVVHTHTRPELSSWCCHSVHQITLSKSASSALCLKSETDGLYQLPPSVTWGWSTHWWKLPRQITLRATGSKEHKRVITL